MRWNTLLVLGFCKLVLFLPLAMLRSQESAGGLSGPRNLTGGDGREGAAEHTAGPAAKPFRGEYEIMHADGSRESGNYVAGYTYVLAPGWAKPRRMLGASEGMGGGYSYLAIRSGQAKQRNSNSSSGMAAQAVPAGGIVMTAIVLAKAENEQHASVWVGQRQAPTGDMDGMGEPMTMGMEGSEGGSAGMPGMSSDGGMGGMMGGMMGGGGSMGGMGGGMPGGMMGGLGMMDGGMGGSMLHGKIWLVPLQECRITALGKVAGEPKLTFAQLKNLEELVRVDCWIEDELTTLRSMRGEAEKFKAAEKSLKELLGREYELQLSKQRDDIDRLNEKLKALQSELARRASAQERVIEVQLGQLVLEVQGLIGERP